MEEKHLRDFAQTKPSVQVMLCLENLLKRIPAGAKILEIGVGNGYVSNFLNSKGYKVIAADASVHCLELLDKSIKRFNIDIEKDALPFEKEEFDAILVFEVLEHLIDPSRTLLKLKEFLKKDGLIAASTPNINWWPFRIKFLFGKCPEDFHTTNHVQFWNISRFRDIFNKVGYKILQQATSFGLPRLPIGASNRIEKSAGYTFIATNMKSGLLGYNQYIIAQK